MTRSLRIYLWSQKMWQLSPEVYTNLKCGWAKIEWVLLLLLSTWHRIERHCKTSVKNDFSCKRTNQWCRKPEPPFHNLLLVFSKLYTSYTILGMLFLSEMYQLKETKVRLSNFVLTKVFSAKFSYLFHWTLLLLDSYIF